MPQKTEAFFIDLIQLLFNNDSNLRFSNRTMNRHYIHSG